MLLSDIESTVRPTLRRVLFEDSSLVRRVICPKRIGLGLELGLGLWLGLASNFGICTTPFRTNDPSDK